MSSSLAELLLLELLEVLCGASGFASASGLCTGRSPSSVLPCGCASLGSFGAGLSSICFYALDSLLVGFPPLVRAVSTLRSYSMCGATGTFQSVRCSAFEVNCQSHPATSAAVLLNMFCVPYPFSWRSIVALLNSVRSWPILNPKVPSAPHRVASIPGSAFPPLLNHPNAEVLGVSNTTWLLPQKPLHLPASCATQNW